LGVLVVEEAVEDLEDLEEEVLVVAEQEEIGKILLSVNQRFKKIVLLS
jgi:hypothetical protein